MELMELYLAINITMADISFWAFLWYGNSTCILFYSSRNNINSARIYVEPTLNANTFPPSFPLVESGPRKPVSISISSGKTYYPKISWVEVAEKQDMDSKFDYCCSIWSVPLQHCCPGACTFRGNSIPDFSRFCYGMLYHLENRVCLRLPAISHKEPTCMRLTRTDTVNIFSVADRNANSNVSIIECAICTPEL